MIKVVFFDYGKVLYGPVLPHRNVRGLARELRKNGIKTGILSNVFSLAAWILKITGGYHGFDPIVLSYREKVSKPDVRIYQAAIKKAAAQPSEILFVDNLEENIKAAQMAGMKTVLAKSSDQVIKDIKKILLKENGLQL